MTRPRTYETWDEGKRRSYRLSRNRGKRTRARLRRRYRVYAAEMSDRPSWPEIRRARQLAKKRRRG